MVPMSLSETLRSALLHIALDSIREGLETGKPLKVVTKDYDLALQEKLASFVTLHRHGALRGCIGHLEPVRPLINDVADNAFSAAFRDPRFSPLTLSELEGLDIHISILTPAQPMSFSSEADLVSQIQPGVDGLILQDGSHRGTFLPSVWESLPDRRQFWLHLKRKAGLPQDYWSSTLKVFRYHTESFGKEAGD